MEKKQHKRRMKRILLANANPYADHYSDLTICCPLVRGKVAIGGKWYMYYRYPQSFVRWVKPRNVGKTIRMLARNRAVRDLWAGTYIK